MKTITFASLIFLLFTAPALKAADLTDQQVCAELWPSPAEVGGVHLAAGPGQILVRGRLGILSDQGIGPEWMIEMDLEGRKIFAHDMNRTWVLADGDQVVWIEPNGRTVSGYFKRYAKPMGFRNGEPLFALEPQLYKDAGLRRLLLGWRRLKSYFTQHMPVAVVHTLQPHETPQLLPEILNEYRKYIKHQADPSRILRLGESSLELAHFEVALTGSLQWASQEAGPLVLEHDGKSQPLSPGDRIFLLDSKNTLVAEFVYRGTQEPFGEARTREEAMALVSRGDHAVVIKRKDSRGHVL